MTRKTNHTFLTLLAAVMLSTLASCRTNRDVAYIQDATPDTVTVLTESQNVTIRPGDELRILITCDDVHASALLNLLTESNRINRTSAVGESINRGGSQQYFLSYVVSPEGTIDFPVLGTLRVEGLTRTRLASEIKNQIISKGILKPESGLVVTVQFTNLMFTVIGEVQKPGAYPIDRDRLTLLEAIGIAGDLTIYGRRDAVWVIRETDGKRQTFKLDLRTSDFMNSPAYYVGQSDVIYVEPNPTRTGQSNLNENTFKSVGFWTSLTSIAISIATLIVTLTNK